MQDCVDIVRVKARDQGAGVLGRDSFDGDAPTAGLGDDIGRDRQRAVSTGADDQPASAPRELLVGRQRSVSELSTVAAWRASCSVSAPRRRQ